MGKVPPKEVMKLNQKKGNGHGGYNPKAIYRHLEADVWEKETPGKVKKDVAYTEEIEAELKASEEPENPEQDNSTN